MNASQAEVVKWWHGGRDYQQGVMLYARLGRNKMLMHTFLKKHERFGRRKLEYELPKSVGLDWKRMPEASAVSSGGGKKQLDSGAFKEKAITQPDSKGRDKKTGHPISPAGTSKGKPLKIQSKTNPKTPPGAAGKIPGQTPGKIPVQLSGKSSSGESVSKTGKKDDRLKRITGNSENTGTDTSPELAKQYPKVIRRLKYEYSDLYNKRSLLHKRMRSVPPENAQQNMNSRAVLLQDIRAISDRLEFLYGFIDDYENRGVIPVSEEIWPAKEKQELSDDPDELKRKKKNLQSANTKDRNQLQYQQKSRGKKDKPMPAGPKRRRIEFRIKKRETDIQLIDQKLVDLENAD